VGSVYSIQVQNDLRRIKRRNDSAYRIALRALWHLERLGPAPDGHVKRVLPQFAPRSVCQFVFLRGGRTILVRYEIDGDSFTVLTVAVRASPRW
jgi:hypothetical protein